MLASLELLDRHCQTSSISPLAEICPTKAFYPLPPKEDVMALLHDYLQTVNVLCPLFQPSVLMSIFDCHDLDAMFQFPSRWACINVVLAMGHILRIKDRSVAQPEHQKSWQFIKNALGALTEICLGPPDLWAIQALIGMVFFLLGTPNAQPCSFLISTAINLAHQIGLERTDEEQSISDPEEREQRRRIFWIAYCIDREISLRFGCVPAQRDEDMVVNLPTDSPTDGVGVVPTRDGQDIFNIFRSCCELAMIKGHVYKRLYSAAATDRPLAQTVAAVASLDEELQRWKKTIPSEYQPDSPFPILLPQSPECGLLLISHYSYFNCVISMHRLIVTRELFKEMDLSQNIGPSTSPTLPSNESVFMSASLCARAARDSIHLIKYMPEDNISIIGILLHYAMVASKTLSFGILRNPNEASRVYDMKLISRVETFLSSLILSTPNEGVDRLVQYCAQYRSVAEAAIKQAAKDPQH
ncbi:hypothetical protein P170DRAFT_417884 [Aspergillus steynii IBT 23096]|uniref:Xylanolytic transcriptional activator regulatory domain-containing protein n=1 Tax=Aspergillus steynii IBT 23096 TaxID=1392250 RepID=A0A2I2FSP9_9EURO|nr:uncharacterized protein P170DRAFT_417884 [Aspergillus steynii IBT 23096]PLB43647.1 hypothetical protein P170DRAFT_417884 [Aspergillus steynii IBT 23096]